MMKTNRIQWIDIAKAITLFLVIVGHTVSNSLVRGIIYSFHMPLFFILSGMTTSYSANFDDLKKRTWKSFKRLIVPAFTMYAVFKICRFFVDGIEYRSLKDIAQYFLNMGESIIWASGADYNDNGIYVYGIGIPWFLIVLFSGRVLLDLLQLKFKNGMLCVICVITAVTGYIIDKYTWLLLSFDVTLSVMLYLHLGKLMRGFYWHSREMLKAGIAFVVWAATFFWFYDSGHSYAELSCRRTTPYFSEYLTAIAGTILVCYISIYIMRIKYLSDKLSVIGRYSLDLLCVHYFDELWVGQYFKVIHNEYIVAVIRVGVDLMIYSLWQKIKKNRLKQL